MIVDRIVSVQRRKGSVAALVGLVVLVLAGLRGTLRRYVIAEQSMMPALRDGDWVLAQRSTGPLDRGDVIVFDHPRRDGFTLVKRVVGLPAETVTITNGQVHIDGEVLAEPWADGPTRPDGAWELAADEVFVLSDARALTLADSRAIGPIHSSAALWRVRLRYWPFADFGRV
jgi:signal peptidase I